jgi:predicted amidophosphoribosyltransferase
MDEFKKLFPYSIEDVLKMTGQKYLCQNCGGKAMPDTPLCEVCVDELEDRYAESEKDELRRHNLPY